MDARRSVLTIPGNAVEMMGSGATSAADAVVLDLEDSIPSSEKTQSRGTVVEALDQFDWTGKDVSVRVNGLDTSYAYRDLVEVLEAAGNSVDTITVPNVARRDDVYTVETILQGIEANVGLDDRIGIEAIVETVEGLANVTQLASAGERLVALVFNAGDYLASLGANRSITHDHSRTDYWEATKAYARNAIGVAAGSTGLAAIDGPYPAIDDQDGLRADCRRAYARGFMGKWAVHPDQISTVNDVFGLSTETVTWARRLLEVMERRDEEQPGPIRFEGEVVDESAVRRAERIVARASANDLTD